MDVWQNDDGTWYGEYNGHYSKDFATQEQAYRWLDRQEAAELEADERCGADPWYCSGY